MSTAKRAYDILRGYVNHGWDQLQGSEASDAERELREAIEQPLPSTTKVADASPKPDRLAPVITVDVARRLLGVDEHATSKQIQRAYDELAKAVDPNRFAADSEALSRARDLQARLRAALACLQANVDPTVRRFEGLEIE